MAEPGAYQRAAALVLPARRSSRSLAVLGLGMAQRLVGAWIENAWTLLQLPALLSRPAWLKAREMWPEPKRRGSHAAFI